MELTQKQTIISQKKTIGRLRLELQNLKKPTVNPVKLLLLDQHSIDSINKSNERCLK